MKRFVGVFAASFLASAVIVLAPVSPALADVCAGTGHITVAAPGLLYPVVGDYEVLGFFWTTDFVDICAPPLQIGGLGATGIVQGYCGHSTGSGTDGRSHAIRWTSAGGFVIFTGEVVGAGRADPHIHSGQSCVAGSLAFFVTFGAISQNCTTTSSTNGLTPVLNDGPMGGNLSVHYSVHTCVGTQL